MLDYETASADLLQQITDLRRKLAGQLMDSLGARDAELLFADGRCTPDWSLANDLGEDVHSTVVEIFTLSSHIQFAEDELALRERPN
jgi:hypothetical protein